MSDLDPVVWGDVVRGLVGAVAGGLFGYVFVAGRAMAAVARARRGPVPTRGPEGPAAGPEAAR